MRQAIVKKIDDIIKFAQNYDMTIRYNMLVDIITDKDDSVTEEEISDACIMVEKQGICIERETSEEYKADNIAPTDFIPADVNIGQKPINVYNLMERLANDEIDLSPGFQRHGGLWPLEQQSRLIESLMLKIPIPTFYFDASDDNKWVVIDGLQRLCAFNNFLVNDKKEKFVGMQYLKEFNGKTFDELPRQYVRRIKETPIISYTVEKGTPDGVVYNIFQRINTGGLELNAQEIRQALYTGTATQLIQEMAKYKEFLNATQNAIDSNRMADREYVTRFIAFTELDYTKEYNGNIDQFLIKALKLVNLYDINSEQIDTIRRNFKRIMSYCARIFGRFAFRKYSKNLRRGPINKAIFEIWSVCFNELSDAQLDMLIDRKDDLFAGFGNLLQNDEFVTWLKAGDQYSTNRRIDAARNLVREYIND